MIPIGRMRKRGTLQTFNRTPDGYGQESLNPSTFATIWVEIRGLTAREALNAAQIKAEVSHKGLMRYTGSLGPVLPNMQLVVNGRRFAIAGVINADERNRRYDLDLNEIIEPTS